MNDDVQGLAEETVNAARTAVTTLVGRYQQTVYDFTEVAAANGRLQVALEQERAERAAAEQDAAGLADELTGANAVIERYRRTILFLAQNAENVTLDAWAREEVDTIRRGGLATAGVRHVRKLIEDKADDDEDSLSLRELFEKAEREGRVHVTAAPGSSPTAIPLGVCPVCEDIVYSGQRFNMHKVSWDADFAGDRPGAMLVFTHREHGGGDHSKDGE